MQLNFLKYYKLYGQDWLETVSHTGHGYLFGFDDQGENASF